MVCRHIVQVWMPTSCNSYMSPCHTTDYILWAVKCAPRWNMWMTSWLDIWEYNILLLTKYNLLCGKVTCSYYKLGKVKTKPIYKGVLWYFMFYICLLYWSIVLLKILTVNLVLPLERLNDLLLTIMYSWFATLIYNNRHQYDLQ